MPHDKNGTKLNEGDEVLLRCKIKSITEQETACNVTAEVIERPDGESYIPEFCHNSRFYEKLDSSVAATLIAQLLSWTLIGQAAGETMRLMLIAEEFIEKHSIQISDIPSLKLQIEFGQKLFNGASEALGLSDDFKNLTCWEELLWKIQAAVKPAPEEDGPSQFAGDHVAETKSLRKQLDDVLQQLHAARGRINGLRSTDCPVRESRERSLATTKLQEAIIWLGMDLKAINEESPGSAPNPYPNSYDPASPVIEPTADGLKL